MVTKNQIDTFLSQDKIAIVGVSRDEKKFGRMVFNELKNKGFNPIPINPLMDEVDGEKSYNEIGALPSHLGSILFLTPSKKTNALLEQAIKKGIKNIWVQQKSDTPQTADLITQNKDFNIITKKCILMFAKPNGFHKFHRSIMGFFGRLPK